MRFRRLVRYLALPALLLAAVGCSNGSLSIPSQGGTSTQGAKGAAASRTPTGTVTVRLGGANGSVVCVITLKNGKGTCKVPTKGDKPGVLHYTGVYSGSPGFKTGTSPTIGVRIEGPTTSATKSS
jgi:hypothetical protein